MTDLPLTMPDGKPLPREYQFTGAELAAEIGREIGMRRHVYENRVREGRMSKPDAARKIAMAEAIADILAKLPGDARYTVKR